MLLRIKVSRESQVPSWGGSSKCEWISFLCVCARVFLLKFSRKVDISRKFPEKFRLNPHLHPAWCKAHFFSVRHVLKNIYPSLGWAKRRNRQRFWERRFGVNDSFHTFFRATNPVIAARQRKMVHGTGTPCFIPPPPPLAPLTGK